MDLHDANPFGILTFIVAPAILTNSSSVLTLATANRFARAVDRARALAARLDEPSRPDEDPAEEHLRLRQLDVAERRVLIVVRALGAFYTAVGSFGLGTLASLLGASAITAGLNVVHRVLVWVALAAGVSGVSALVTGAGLLVFESRMTRRILHAEAESIRRRVRRRQEARAEDPAARR